MAKRVVLVRHRNDPPDDRVHTYLVKNGFEAQPCTPFAGDSLGKPDPTLAGTVIYGGPYNVLEEDRYPFLKEEARWIRACMEAEVPVLGICQGAQQIAYVLGAQVGPISGEPHEFGYYRIDPVQSSKEFLSGPLWVTQHHCHTFSIPKNAEHLASSDLFPNQAFRYGDKVYALQFHPEVTIEGFRRRQSEPWADDYGKPGAQTRGEQDRLMYRHDARQAEWFYSFLETLFGKA